MKLLFSFLDWLAMCAEKASERTESYEATLARKANPYN